MSWVAVSVMGPLGAAMSALPRKRTPYFQPCQYCKRPPDVGQTYANCLGCGAALNSVLVSPPEATVKDEATLRLNSLIHETKLTYHEQPQPKKSMFDFLKRKKKEPKKVSGYSTSSHDAPSSNPMDPTSPLYWSMIHSASSDSDRPCGGSGSHSDHGSSGGSSHDAGTASGYDGGSSASCGASCGSSGGGD